MSVPCRPLLAAMVLLTLAAGCFRPSGEPFPVEAYLEAPTNLQGNRYSLDAAIEAHLEWREGVGRLVAVQPLGQTSQRLPVFIADSLQTNLMVAQRYRLDLIVRRDGLLHIQSLRKL
jgi:hypothetical protein